MNQNRASGMQEVERRVVFPVMSIKSTFLIAIAEEKERDALN
jgi:hypothetical protein